MRLYWERFTWGMVHGEGEGEIYYPSVIPPQSHQFPHITADPYTIGCPLVNLQRADSLGMIRRNDIREVSGNG